LHLTTIKQKHNEPATDYIMRFRDTRNWCFNLNISDKDLADLSYLGLTPHLKEKLESWVFSDVSQVLQQDLDCVGRAKECRSFQGVVKNLGMNVTLMRLSIVASCQTTMRPTCV
jgi:hypothetical protein